MQIRLLNTADIEQAKNLANYAFNEKEFANWFFDQYVQPRQLVGSFDDQNKLQCMLCLSPYNLQLDSNEHQTEYITTVATTPESRGRGYFKPLLKYVFEDLRSNGKYFVILKAIESKLYSPLGFAFCYSHLRYSMPLKELEYFDKSTDLNLVNAVNCELYIESMQQLYTSLIVNKYHATSLRTLSNWRNLLKVHTMDGGHIVLALKAGKPVGYMLYYIRNNYFEVFELLATDAAVQAQFLNMAYQHRTQVKNFFWRTCVDNTAYLDMNIAQYSDSFYPQIAPFMTVRVLDARKLLENIVPNKDANVCLQINDDFLEHNNCTIRLTSKDGHIDIQDTLDKPDVCVDIATLAQLVFGAYSAKELLFAGKIVLNNGSCIEQIDNLFSKKVNYINEEF